MPKKKTQPTLSVQKTQELLMQFFQLNADLKSGKEVTTFLQDFLTDSEQTMLAKRLAVAWELYQGKSYGEIQKQFGVSSATISAVAEVMMKPGMQLAMKKLTIDEWAEKWSEKLKNMFK